ncbi:MAG: hypothetical protein ACI8W8_000247 [Rhodothermales bacterium]|jgi:hypothetical protein
MRLLFLLFLLLFAPAALAAVYRVGPGQALAAIGDVPWESLEPGDLVEIYWRDTPYHEKFNIKTVATANRPLTVRGIPNAAGELPILDARNATTRLALDFYNEHRGVIRIGPHRIDVPDCWVFPAPFDCTNPNPIVTPTGPCPDPVFPPFPAHIIVENFDIRSARDPYSYVDDEGVTQAYQSRSAGIYIEQCRGVTIRNCRFTDCGNGLFSSHNTYDVVIEGCHFSDNGIIGSDRYHNAYTESHGITYQYNHFAPLKTHSLGNNIKDRSSGTVIRYNWIEGGNRQLDLVDSDYIDIYQDPQHPYQITYIYGNILIEPGDIGNRQMIHYGGDTGKECQYRVGDCWFYNNTVISLRTGTTTIARLTYGNFHCWNNIIYHTSSTAPINFMENEGEIYVRNNYLRSGHSYVQSIIDTNLIAPDPGFADSAYTLLIDSVCIDAGRNITVPAALWPQREYVLHRGSIVRDTALPFDLGAREATLPDAPPVASDDSYSIIENRDLLIAAHQGLTANDHIDATYPSRITLLSAPSHGSLTLASDGSFRYTPATDFTGSDSFSYGLIDDPPALTHFIGNDPDDGDSIYNPGDTLTLHFDRATNRPGGSGAQPKSAVDAMFAFSQPIGADYSGQWITRDMFRVTLADTSGSSLALGLTTVVPAGITPVFNGPSTSSPSSASSGPLIGRFAVSDIHWTNGIFVNIAGNRLAQIPDRSSWLAGASSVQQVDYTPGVTHFAEWTVASANTSTNLMLGFNDVDTKAHFDEIDFALYARFGGAVDIREHGVEIRVAVGNWTPGTIFRIELDTEVRYLVDGQVVYTSAQPLTPDRFPMILDSSLANFAIVDDAIISVGSAVRRSIARESDPIADSATVTIHIQADIRPTTAEFANPFGTSFANSANFDLDIVASDPDGLATGWLISESAEVPTLVDPRWSPTLPTTHSLSAEGSSRLYLWVRSTEVDLLAETQVIRADSLRFGTIYVDDQPLVFGYGDIPGLAEFASPIRARANFEPDLIADFRPAAALTRWHLRVRSPATLTWDVSELLESNRLLLQPPSSPAIDLAGSGSFAVGVAGGTFEIAHGPEESATLNLLAGWNLVGLPIMHTALAPPNAWYWSGSAFRPTSVIMPERGYWLFADSASSTTHQGIVADGLFSLHAGWSLISPARAHTVPLGITQAWQWQPAQQSLQRLQTNDSLFPGQAYWLHAPRRLTVELGPSR